MVSKIETATARSAEPKVVVSQLERELAAPAKEQAQMDALRWRAHRDAVQAKKTWDVGSLQITHRK